MSNIWYFVPWLPDEPGLDRLGEYCRFVNVDEMFRAWRDAKEPTPSDFPTARLELTLESFSLDCFIWGANARAYTLVSQDLRDAMALGPRDIEYLPVDASLSAPLPRSKNYQIMRVPVVENISDPGRSDYEIRNIAGLPQKVIWATRMAIRQHANPAHEIFQDSFFPGTFCTEKFAVRILQRQCTGVRFYDPEHFDSNPARLRSLRGIEEETWDPVQEKFHTKLLQAIPDTSQDAMQAIYRSGGAMSFARSLKRV